MQGRGAGRLRPRLSYVFIIARSGKRSRLGRRGGKVHPDLKAAETAAGVERAAARPAAVFVGRPAGETAAGSRPRPTGRGGTGGRSRKRGGARRAACRPPLRPTGCAKQGRSGASGVRYVRRGQDPALRETGNRRRDPETGRGPAGGLQAAPTSNRLCETKPKRSARRKVQTAGSRPRPTGGTGTGGRSRKRGNVRQAAGMTFILPEYRNSKCRLGWRVGRGLDPAAGTFPPPGTLRAEKMQTDGVK